MGASRAARRAESTVSWCELSTLDVSSVTDKDRVKLCRGKTTKKNEPKATIIALQHRFPSDPLITQIAFPN